MLSITIHVGFGFGFVCLKRTNSIDQCGDHAGERRMTHWQVPRGSGGAGWLTSNFGFMDLDPRIVLLFAASWSTSYLHKLERKNQGSREADEQLYSFT